MSESQTSYTPGAVGAVMQLPVSFYLACLLSNVMFISLYAIQVYSQHSTCIVNGNDVTVKFDLAFKLGLAIVFIDFINLNVLSFFQCAENNSITAEPMEK